MSDDSFRVHWLPVVVFIAVPVTFLTTFAIAVSLGHVEADFPYISDTGTKSPESCIFGQLLNLAAMLVGVNMYVRYKQVEHHLSHHNNAKLRKANYIALYIGLLAALGMSMVGNFQETNVLVVHLIGAVLAFGVGGIYGAIHVVISYKCHPHLTSLRICHLRAFLCIVIFVTFTATFWLDAVSKKHFHGKDPRKWYPEDGVRARNATALRPVGGLTCLRNKRSAGLTVCTQSNAVDSRPLNDGTPASRNLPTPITDVFSGPSASE